MADKTGSWNMEHDLSCQKGARALGRGRAIQSAWSEPEWCSVVCANHSMSIKNTMLEVLRVLTRSVVVKRQLSGKKKLCLPVYLNFNSHLWWSALSKDCKYKQLKWVFFAGQLGSASAWECGALGGWQKWLGGGPSGLPCWICFPHDPEKWLEDGRTHLNYKTTYRRNRSFKRLLQQAQKKIYSKLHHHLSWFIHFWDSASCLPVKQAKGK